MRYINNYDKKYAIDSYGNVFRTHKNKNKLLKVEISNRGYKRVSLSKNGSAKKHSIHRLVAISFICNKFEKPCVNHKNGDKLDNRVDNLEWVTYSENEIHSISVLGKTYARGGQLPQTKLTESQVIEIKYILREESFINLSKLGRKYNVSRKNISAIRDGKSWTHIKI